MLATTPGYETPPHIEKLIDFLERAERREFDRGMVIMPPRMGKSHTVSRRFPAWWFGRTPGAEIIHASYQAELVHGFGRRIRNVMTSDTHLQFFPRSRLSGDSTAAHRFDLEEGGSYVAAGVGGGITGRGADLLLIDDPVKGREQADSQIYRDKAWDWYLNDAASRLLPDAVVLLVTTRWHEDDLAGRLLEAQEEGGDRWEILHMPAIDEFDQPLWPERYSLAALKRIRARNLRTWEALYQGRPTADQGTHFERAWFRRGLMPSPEEMRFYGASDYASSDEKTADYTVHGVIGVDQHGRWWLADVYRRKEKTNRWVDALVSMMQRWRPVFWLEERGGIEKTTSPFIADEMRRRHVYVRRFQLSSIADKEERSLGIQAHMAHHGLWLPHDADYAAAVIKELIAFPAGANDDAVDMLGLFGRASSALTKPGERRARKKAAGEGMTYGELIQLEDRRRGGRRHGW